MLNVTTAVKNMFKHDYLPYNAPVGKSLVLYFADLSLTITEDDIYNDEFEWEHFITGDQICFGDCNSDSLKFSVEGIDANIVGHQFTAKITIGESDYKIGTFIVSEASCEDGTDVKKVVAYDLMQKFDKDVADWYNALTFPMTLKTFRESLCTHCGVTYETTSLTNDSMSIEKTISPSQLSGRDVLRACEQLSGCFGHMNRDGVLRHVVLSQSNPVDTIDSTSYDSLKLEEYTTDTISKVQIRQEDGDVGAYSGTGSNCYTITDNFLVYGKSASDLSTIVTNVATNIIGITYRPFTYTGQGLLYLDSGDYITLSGSETVNTYMLHRTMKGIQILNDEMSAKGNKEQTEDTSLNIQIQQLRGKTNVLKRTVEETVNTITELNTALSENGQTVSEMVTSVVQNASGLSTEITNRKSLQETILGKNYCDDNTIDDDDVCDDDGDSVVTHLQQDSQAKLEATANSLLAQLTDNVNQLTGSIQLTNTQFNTLISNLSTNTSTNIEQLEDSISAKLTTEDLCNELNLSTGGLNFTGNRFTWNATNSSMTANGTLTCNNMIATNVKVSGEITGSEITGSIFTAGQPGGSYTHIDSQAVETTYISVISNCGESYSASLDNGELGFYYNSVRQSYYGLDYMSVSNAYISTLNNGTPYTSHNCTIPKETDDINATVRSSSTYSGTYYIIYNNTSGDINVPTIGWVKARQDSDERLKKDIKPLIDMSDKYMRLKPVSYRFKDHVNDDSPHYGFLAQDVEKIYPNSGIVEYDEDVVTKGEKIYIPNDGVYRLNDREFHALHVQMIQMQQHEIENMKKQIEELRGKIA